MSETLSKQRDYRKAFGQLASTKTQRIESLKPVEILLDTQEDVAGGVHTIDFDKSDIIIKTVWNVPDNSSTSNWKSKRDKKQMDGFLGQGKQR